jgi:glycosyltransferase involved in cell wall biosynthesis
MRALYLLPAEGFGGAERQGVVHISNLSKAGIEVVAVSGPGQPVVTELDRAGVRDYLWYKHFPTYAIEARGLLASVARPWRYLKSWWRATRDLAALAVERRVDLIFASRTFGWMVAWTIGRKLGIPVIWRAGSMLTGSLERIAARILSSFIRPDALVANSEAGRALYSTILPGVSTAVLPNGVDTSRFTDETRRCGDLRQRLQLGDVPLVGLAARPAPEKGLQFLAEVVRIVGKTHGEVHFLIAGEFPWRKYYENLFAQQGLSKKVTFLGHVADIETFYAACDVVVLTSNYGYRVRRPALGR